jgi:hypothetical protein
VRGGIAKGIGVHAAALDGGCQRRRLDTIANKFDDCGARPSQQVQTSNLVGLGVKGGRDFDVLGMPAVPPIPAAVAAPPRIGALCHSLWCASAAKCVNGSLALLDDRINLSEQCGRKRYPKRLRSLEIHEMLKSRRLFDR